MSAGTSAFGTKLQATINNAANTNIAEIVDLNGPGFETHLLDATSHSTPQNASGVAGRDKLPCKLINGGEVTFTLNFIPGHLNHQFIENTFLNQANTAFNLVFPDALATSWPFNAFVTKITPKEPVDGILAADVTMEISGLPAIPVNANN